MILHYGRKRVADRSETHSESLMIPLAPEIIHAVRQPGSIHDIRPFLGDPHSRSYPDARDGMMNRAEPQVEACPECRRQVDSDEQTRFDGSLGEKRGWIDGDDEDDAVLHDESEVVAPCSRRWPERSLERRDVDVSEIIEEEVDGLERSGAAESWVRWGARERVICRGGSRDGPSDRGAHTLYRGPSEDIREARKARVTQYTRSWRRTSAQPGRLPKAWKGPDIRSDASHRPQTLDDYRVSASSEVSLDISQRTRPRSGCESHGGPCRREETEREEGEPERSVLLDLGRMDEIGDAVSYTPVREVEREGQSGDHDEGS